MPFVYMLIVKNNSKKITYVGWTLNIHNRLKLHNEGKGAKFTRGRKWELIFYKKYKSKKEAIKEEYKMKRNRKLRDKIKRNYLNNKNFQYFD